MGILERLHFAVRLFCFSPVWVKRREAMEQEKEGSTLKERIRSGQIRRQDVTRRLAELAFGKANDCVRLALEDDPQLSKLDLSLLSEVKRNEKGTVEIKLIDRLKALEQLAQAAMEDNDAAQAFLQALRESGEMP
ncbi:MAG: terminase small subunit [Oscillospiraceae bacterium]|nr:terminase small subunit [Oscillospiraceae bacterium]